MTLWARCWSGWEPSLPNLARFIERHLRKFSVRRSWIGLPCTSGIIFSLTQAQSDLSGYVVEEAKRL